MGWSRRCCRRVSAAGHTRPLQWSAWKGKGREGVRRHEVPTSRGFVGRRGGGDGEVAGGKGCLTHHDADSERLEFGGRGVQAGGVRRRC